jgi:hypothetical protein
LQDNAMKIKTAATDALFALLYLIGACLITMLAEALVSYIINHIVALTYSALTVIRIVIYSFGVAALMGVIGYYEGYREAYCPVGESLASVLLAAIPHLLLAMLFRFQGFISGSVRFTAGLIHNGRSITYDKLVNETPYWLFVLIFAAYAAVYAITFTVAKYLGAQKRVIDRAELRQEKSGSAPHA